MVEVVRAGPEHREQVATTLASAFGGDPLFAWMTGVDTARLEARISGFFRAVAKENLRKPDHLVFTSHDGTGAAVWQPVDKWKMPTGEMLRLLPSIVGTFRHRVPVMMGALTAIEKAHPTEPHYYLEMLGTRQDRQSTGVGTAVITAMLDRCDTEGLPAYLECSNPRNIPFYARHGFEVRREVECGKGAPTVTTMWREPRG